MKFKILTIIFLAGSLFANAQTSKKYLRYKNKINYRTGYIINSDSTKIDGLIKDGALSEFSQFSFVNFVSKEGKKAKFYPGSIKGYGHGSYDFESDGFSFYKVAMRGKRVNLYEMTSGTTWSSPNPTGMGMMTHSATSENYYVKKTDENNFKLVKKRKFAEEFSIYFSDCESLKLKIENKELTHKDINRIIGMYNYCN